MNWFWIKFSKENVADIGLNKHAFSELGLVWQYIPRVKKGMFVSKNAPLATVQSTTRLQSLVSPLGGKITHVEGNIVNRPDEITETTVLFKIDISEPEYALSIL